MPTPHWKEAEQAVIASCLSNDNAYPACKSVTANDFIDPRHRIIWRAIEDLARRRKPINTLTAWLSDPENISYRYISQLVEDLPTAVGCWYYAELVHEAAERRRMAAAGYAIADAAERGAPNLKAKAAALVKGRNRFGGGVPL